MLVNTNYLSRCFLLLSILGSLYGKRIVEHLDFKHHHGETMLYVITFNTPHSLPVDLKDVGLTPQEQCNDVADCYIYAHQYHILNGPCLFSNSTCMSHVHRAKTRVHKDLDNHQQVLSYSEIYQRKRSKRGYHVTDPRYRDQWHLSQEAEAVGYYNGRRSSHEISLNLTGVWDFGIIGEGITVGVVDDGLEWNNTDLFANYSPEGSIDINDRDNDPMPNEHLADPNDQQDNNAHGTRCAGEIAAVANNSVCGIGVAYGAKVAGVRALDGSMTDITESDAFSAKRSVNDIYTCSWGPEDDGRTVDGPRYYAQKSVEAGIKKGRGGYGSIYVVASGNGGGFQDNCNSDGYANSIYFVTIGAILSNGKTAVYSELCASMLAVAPSGGEDMNANPGITTTDITLRRTSTGCTAQHSGTSAAAPLGAAVIALLLSANPCLTWRDVKHLVVITSHQIADESEQWTTNNAGLHHSHYHGFGLLSAWNLVNAAQTWKQIPPMQTYTKEDIHISVPIKPLGESLILRYTVSPNDLVEHGLNILEYVQVVMTIKHRNRGHLMITLKCPGSPHVSILASYRDWDVNTTYGFVNWKFSTVRCWGEQAVGEYVLNITDRTGLTGQPPSNSYNRVDKWSLILRGSSLTFNEYQQIIRSARSTFSGEPLINKVKPECYPPPVDTEEKQIVIDPYILGMIVVGGLAICALGALVLYKIVRRRVRGNRQQNTQDLHNAYSLKEPTRTEITESHIGNGEARPMMPDSDESSESDQESVPLFTNATNS